MAGLGSLFTTLTSALNTNNITGAVAATSALQSAFGTSQAVTAQAQSFLSNFLLSQASGNAVGMQFALSGLMSMQAQLPQSVVPLIGALGNPAVQADKVQSALAVANIQQALAHTTFL